MLWKSACQICFTFFSRLVRAIMHYKNKNISAIQFVPNTISTRKNGANHFKVLWASLWKCEADKFSEHLISSNFNILFQYLIREVLNITYIKYVTGARQRLVIRSQPQIKTENYFCDTFLSPSRLRSLPKAIQNVESHYNETT